MRRGDMCSTQWRIDRGASKTISVLNLNSTVSKGIASLEARQARALDLTPLVVDDMMGAAMSAADFGSYRAIVLGDPSYSTEPSRFAAAEANRAV
mgnify:CR=1 FL=1